LTVFFLISRLLWHTVAINGPISHPGLMAVKSAVDACLAPHLSQQVSCFVEFEDVNSAASCHMMLQGAVLASSDRGGIRIQFSKNPYGMRWVRQMLQLVQSMNVWGLSAKDLNVFLLVHPSWARSLFHPVIDRWPIIRRSPLPMSSVGHRVIG